MFPQTAPADIRLPERDAPRNAAAMPLGEEHRAEALAFLAERPLHTAILAGFIRDNGVVNTLNRGTFYGCRDDQLLLR